MLDILKIRKRHGYQAIPDIRKAQTKASFRGLPLIHKTECLNDCAQCINACPTGAIQKKPLTIDMGQCVFCGDCEKICPEKCIQFANYHKISSTNRKHLIIDNNITPEIYMQNAVEVKKKIKKMFSHSLKLRQVSAGGCNACEMELAASNNVNFDMGRFGIDFVASPRHADGLVITGPITENMAAALEDTYNATPHPKIIILAGTCAISGGVFKNSEALNRKFPENHEVDLFIPGCPVHPLTIINGILDYLGHKP